MAYRITDADVEELIEVDVAISLTPFIAAAEELVTELCLASGYSTTRLKIIESWLAGHFYTMRDQQVANEAAGSVRVSYQYDIGRNLQQTKYGQTAILMDTAGNLAALSKRAEEGKTGSVGVAWLGEDYDTDEEDD